MSPDAQIEVLIKVVDELSSQIKVISNNLEGVAKTTEETNTRMSDGFLKTTNSLIAIGNVARSVEGIFSAYENMQLRVENASLRVENAQQRLSDAQTRLNRLIRDGKQNSDEYTDAQVELERATRNLQISQNNQQRVQNQLIGGYISMVVNGLSVVASLTQMARSLQTVNIMMAITEALLNPVALGIGIAAAGIAVYAIKQMGAVDSTNSFNESQNNLSLSVQKTNSDLQYQNKLFDEFMGKVNPMINAPREGETENINQQKNASEQIANIQLQLLDETSSEKRQKLKDDLEWEKAVLERLKNEYKIKYQNFKDIETTYAEDKKNMFAITNADITNGMSISHNEMLKIIDNFATEAMTKYQAVIDLQNRLASFGGGSYSVKSTSSSSQGMSIDPSKAGGSSSSINWGSAFSSKYGDFIARPGQPMQEFSSNDTVIGVKDIKGLGGVNITIGAVYGLSATDVSRALKRELVTKMSI